MVCCGMIIIKCFWISYCDILFSLKLLLANDMHLTPVCKSTVSLGKKKKKKYSVLCHQTSPCNFQGSMAPCGLWSAVLDALFKPTKEVKDVFTVVSVNWVSPLVSAIFTPDGAAAMSRLLLQLINQAGDTVLSVWWLKRDEEEGKSENL